MNAPTSDSRHRHRSLSLRARVGLCALLVMAGAAALWLIFSTEPVAERETQVRQTAMLVEVTSPEHGTFTPVIEAMGTVRPARHITLSPRVPGEVAGLAPAFVPGSFVRKGDVLVWIDDADYRTALQQRESELEQTIAELEMEHGRRELAEQDYEQLGKPLPENRRALVLREPQLRQAEAAIQAARAALEQARLDLQRTEVKAPFDAQVLSRDVNVGSQVAAGDPLARLAGIGTYWVETTIPVDELQWLRFAEGEDEPGAAVEIRHRAAWPAGATREGRLIRLIGELEGNTRLARALVEVDDPLALGPGMEDAPGLIIGAFVETRIQGREIVETLRLPRDTIRADDTVWLMRDGALAIAPVDIVFRDARHAYVREGIELQDRIVTSSLATVREGVPLRTAAGDPARAAAPEQP